MTLKGGTGSRRVSHDGQGRCKRRALLQISDTRKPFPFYDSPKMLPNVISVRVDIRVGRTLDWFLGFKVFSMNDELHPIFFFEYAILEFIVDVDA